jgi:NAD(P)-dependent dehydrogenase (short-subunit alcohol dehydrogenase family)
VDDFAGRTGAVLVTGGSGGIGAAICRMFAERGSDVMMGMPDLWKDIVAEYQRLLDQKSEQAAMELHQKRVKAWRRQRLKNQILNRVLETVAVVFVIGYLICLMWMINLNHRGLLDTFLF